MSFAASDIGDARLGEARVGKSGRSFLETRPC
jgi:hypothetical protein